MTDCSQVDGSGCAVQIRPPSSENGTCRVKMVIRNRLRARWYRVIVDQKRPLGLLDWRVSGDCGHPDAEGGAVWTTIPLQAVHRPPASRPPPPATCQPPRVQLRRDAARRNEAFRDRSRLPACLQITCRGPKRVSTPAWPPARCALGQKNPAATCAEAPRSQGPVATATKRSVAWTSWYLRPPLPRFIQPQSTH